MAGGMARLGAAFGGALKDYTSQSLQEKMKIMDDQRKMQQHQQMVKSYADQMRKMGGDAAQVADVYEATGGNDQLTKMFVDYGMLGGQGQGQQQGGFPQMQQFAPQQQGTGFPEYGMQTQQGQAPEMTQPAQIAPMQQEAPVSAPVGKAAPLKTLEDYYVDEAKKMYPNANPENIKGPPQEKLLRKAKMRMDAAVASLKVEQGAEKIALQKQEKGVELIKPSVVGSLRSGEEASHIIPNFEIAIHQNENMKTSPTSWDALAESMAGSYPWMGNFISKNAQVLSAQMPAFIADFKGKMGGVLTDAKIRLISRKVAGVGKDKDANRIILYTGYFDKKLDQVKAEKTQEILDKNDGMIPKDFNQKIKKEMLPYQKEVDRDLSRLLNNKKPISDFSKTAIESAGPQTVDTLTNDVEKYTGKTATDTETGKKYKFEGGKWMPLK